MVVGLTISMHFQQFEDHKFLFFPEEHIPDPLKSLTKCLYYYLNYCYYSIITIIIVMLIFIIILIIVIIVLLLLLLLCLSLLLS